VRLNKLRGIFATSKVELLYERLDLTTVFAYESEI